MSVTFARLWDPEFRHRHGWLLGVVALELLSVVAYFGLTSARITDLRYVLYPFVWITVGIWAVAAVDVRSDAPTSHRVAAAVVAAAYFLVLAWLAGLIAVYLGGHAHAHSHIHGLQIGMAAPGWGPRVAYVTHAFHVYFVPYRVIGFLALAYLVYATVVDATGAALSGALGLASCVGCTFPIFASLAAGVVGPSVAATVTDLSVDLSTAVFLAAVALLVVRPGFRR
ncbi:hypothetical protein HUG10_12040 [Halorarum halophilum]|uniref:Uncharacterized protein n=1 Tax=Halorarum halophilum TaxID=2743090 RepID=A0A7D5KGC4_9EURY|nr:hypothetical protein [Halobaculum halophilum]QLG28236.1 hypothetical protein HUG10_12040 [Halobaculum halophilum]